MPINMSNADVLKMADGVQRVLTQAMQQGKTKAFVKKRDFFETMQFSNLRLFRFADEITDYMITDEAYERFGEWVFTEYGDGYSVFVELARKGEPTGLDAQTDRDDTFFLPPSSTRRTFRRAERGNDAGTHDDDIRRAEEQRNQNA